MKRIRIASLEALPAATEEFLAAMDDRTVYAFRGEMGAGKTTFISELCKRLGVEDVANSPSFSIINEYRSEETGELIYHFDFYRLESPEEGYEIGATDYFDSGALCLVEWPERVEELLPGDTRNVTISVEPDGTRVLQLED
jgi:tRNA threonylcarbamoyladenosine biosynthesis protein TsaE